MSIRKAFKKGEIVQEAGQKRVKSYKVNRGLLRSYFTDENGKQHNFIFAPEGWVLGDLDAIAFGKASNLTIEALEESEVMVVDFVEYENQDWQKGLERMMRRAGTLQRRILMMMSTSALERYEYFMDVYPDLSNRLTQRHIASYLGITPQALSKLRAQRVGKVYGS
jgi:CRP-like cAMP-binding protein